MPFNWSLNPYMGCAHRCTFCYVRAFERRADRPSGEDYGRSVRVKTNIAAVLRRELARRSWRAETIAIGAATDPYQPAEGRYRLTRGCLEALAEARNPFGIITRGPMIVRDVDILSEASRLADVSVTFSVPTLDREIWRRTEPGTAPPRQRLRALRVLVDAGVRAGVGIAPILPGLSDRPDLLEDVVKAARDAGAASIWANVLYLRPGTREHFLEHLARDWPELLPRYERLYAGRAYLGDAVTAPIQATVAALRARHEIGVRIGPRPNRVAGACLFDGWPARPAPRDRRTAKTRRSAGRTRIDTARTPGAAAIAAGDAAAGKTGARRSPARRSPAGRSAPDEQPSEVVRQLAFAL